jgi:ABC-2 type transport system permease protein
MAESSALLRDICALNPFTHVVELIRFLLYLQINWGALTWVLGTAVVLFAVAIRAYDPSRALMQRKG